MAYSRLQGWCCRTGEQSGVVGCWCRCCVRCCHVKDVFNLSSGIAGVGEFIDSDFDTQLLGSLELN